jgi:hypothetical protein
MSNDKTMFYNSVFKLPNNNFNNCHLQLIFSYKWHLQLKNCILSNEKSLTTTSYKQWMNFFTIEYMYVNWIYIFKYVLATILTTMMQLQHAPIQI